VWVEHLTEAQKKAYILADNRLAELADWNMDLVDLEINELKEFDFNIDIIGFDETPEEAELVPESEGVYTPKIDIPHYKITGECPEISELCDRTKEKELYNSAAIANITEKEREFLQIAAYRHTVFDYAKIAEYYAHASAEMQREMEAAALVIIDINDAIKNGYVKLYTEIESIRDNDDEE
jgi:hypothetical protein